jgi:hypothetical protein
MHDNAVGFYAGQLLIFENKGSVNVLSSAAWDPTGRFVAYTGSMGKKPDVFRVVEVSSGA